jgi:hypothetical protein
MRKRILLLVLIQVTFSVGCGGATPAGFWGGYRPELIEQKFSDQGPWGGARWITWVAQAEGTFRVSEVLGFAESKGWSCREPQKYSATQLRQWQVAGQAVFPLHFSPGDSAPNNDAVKKFPRSISEDSLIVECKTGWIRVDTGTDQSSDALGYIQIEESGTRMAIYHLWGEI